MSTRVSPPVCRQPGTVDSSNEKRARRHAIDFSRTSIIHTGDIPSFSCSTPRGPDIEKELPRIPPTSTGVCDTEPAAVSSDMIAPSVTLAPSLPPLSVSLEAFRGEVSCLQTLELQHLAEVKNPDSQAGPRATTSGAGLFARSGPEPASCSQVPNERTNLVLDDPSSEEHPWMDFDSEASSFLPATPTIRRFFPQEVDMAATSYEARRIPKRVDQDGSFPCPRRGCYDVLPTRKAYTCHIHIHLIHEGSSLCELCGTRFIDDDHKDDHLNSCPKLPTFHEIESFPPMGPVQNFLSRLHL